MSRTAQDSPAPPGPRLSLPRRVLRWVRRLALIGVAIILILVAAGAIWQAVAAARDREAFPPPGRMVNIGTHRLHLDCRGEGDPVVLMDAGAGGWSLGWFVLQPELAKETTACAFDRSGLGWSEAGPGTFDADTSSRELHALMERAGVRRPVVYLGHSLGANLAQDYFKLFPEEVAGIVLVDPGVHEDMLEDFEGSRQEAEAIGSCGWPCTAAGLAARLGVVRLAATLVKSRYLTGERQKLYRAGLSQPRSARAMLGSLVFVPRTAWQIHDIASFGDVPLTVLYSGDTRKPEGEETEEDVRRWYRRTLEKMSELAGRSSRGRGPIVVEGATHTSIVLNPEHAAQVLSATLAIIRDHRESPGPQ